MKLLIIRLVLLIMAPFLPLAIIVDVLLGDIMTGVKTTASQKIIEHLDLFAETWNGQFI